MTSVWLLVIMSSQSGFFSHTAVVQVEVFEKAERCVRNIEAVKKQFKDSDEVSATCVEKLIYPGLGKN